MLSLITLAIIAAVYIAIIVGSWKTHTKAGQPGWAMFIPIYNIYIITKIADKPGWFIFLFLIPLVNIYAIIMIASGISTKFGKGLGYTLGLIFLGPIFFPMLGLGNAQYNDDIFSNALGNDILDDGFSGL